MKTICLHIFLFSVLFGTAQSFRERSSYEKKWAFFHPFAALKVKHVYKEAQPLFNQIIAGKSLDVYDNGGKQDAFRHLFFMAAFAQKVKPKKIIKLGIAHEKGNYKQFKKHKLEHGELPDSLSSVMDLHNNYLGVETGIKYKNVELKELAARCLVSVQAGMTMYMKRNHAGQYLNCKGEIIDLINYKDKWNIPKCLIPTNE